MLLTSVDLVVLSVRACICANARMCARSRVCEISCVRACVCTCVRAAHLVAGICRLSDHNLYTCKQDGGEQLGGIR
jgi:hypothetical protein